MCEESKSWTPFLVKMESSFLAFPVCAVLASLGNLSGYFLLRISPEEKKPLRKAINAVKSISFWLTILTAFLAFSLPYNLLIPGIAFLISYFVKKPYFPRSRENLSHLFLGIIFAIGFTSPPLNIFLFCTVFLYGMCNIIVKRERATLAKTILPTLSFLLGSITGSLVFTLPLLFANL